MEGHGEDIRRELSDESESESMDELDEYDEP